MSKKICNILIILFILVCLTVSLFAAYQPKADWKAVVIPLALAALVLVMYQGVIYKGKTEKLAYQIPWDKIPGILSSGNRVTIGQGSTTITPTLPNNTTI